MIDIDNFYHEVTSCDGRLYICHTCHTKLKKSEIPAQAVWNKLEFFLLPDDLANMNRLERAIISRRIQTRPQRFLSPCVWKVDEEGRRRSTTFTHTETRSAGDEFEANFIQKNYYNAKGTSTKIERKYLQCTSQYCY